jgi:pilus assembly protein CpaB
MILRLAFFALMALGLLGFGTVAWISTRPLAPDLATITAAAKVTVLVAAHPVRAGNLLRTEDLTARETTRGELGSDGNLDTPEARRALVGAMVRISLVEGDVVRTKDVMRPGDHGFLAAVLSPGMRAVSVGVDNVTGSAGLIWPGDRIDLILTQSIADASLPIGHRLAAETVLSDVRVIAIDQQLMQGVAPDGTEGKARTVTMEVTSVQAEHVSVATRIGRLSLAVRSPDHALPAIPTAAPKTTWASDVSPALGTNVTQTIHSVIRVFQGSGESKEFRFDAAAPYPAVANAEDIAGRIAASLNQKDKINAR